ncbi:hypothetical protein PO909_029471 [Leuciscus waleckii]
MTPKIDERNTSIPRDSVSFSHDKTTVSKCGKNFCFVCGKAQSKIVRYFKAHENENVEIAEALSFPAHSKKRKELLQALRNKGNFLHNNNVLKKGTGELKVKRCSIKQNSKTYEYCVYCQGMFVRKELWRHMKRCSAKKSKELVHCHVIKPVNFMATVKAAKEVAGFSEDEKTVEAPSFALKIGQHLLQVSSIIQCNAIIAGDKELRECAEEFQTLYRTKWTECVSYTARMSAKEKKYNKTINLPRTEDIQMLTKHLEKVSESAYNKLEKAASMQNYSDLARVCLTRVITFNR